MKYLPLHPAKHTLQEGDEFKADGFNQWLSLCPKHAMKFLPGYTYRRLVAAPAPLVAPYFASYARPALVESERNGVPVLVRPATLGQFTHYEIQTVREEQHDDGSSTFHTVTTLLECDPEAIHLGPVLYGVYGRNPDGTAEHLFDRVSL